MRTNITEELASESGVEYANDVSDIISMAYADAKRNVAKLLNHAAPFQEAFIVDISPQPHLDEVCMALSSYFVEVAALKEDRWKGNEQVGRVAGYFFMRQLTEFEPIVGFNITKLRTTLLLSPNPNGLDNCWLKSIKLPHLAYNAAGDYYFNRSVLLTCRILTKKNEIANEGNNSLNVNTTILRWGKFDETGLTPMCRR